MKKQRKFELSLKILMILLFLVISSFLIEFKYGDYSLTQFSGNWQSDDQNFMIPLSYRLTKDSFFENDVMVNMLLANYPVKIFNFIAQIYNIFGDMFLTLVFLTLMLKTIFVFSTYLLSKLLLKNNNAALLATAFLSFTHFMGIEEVGISQTIWKTFVFAFVPLIFYIFLKYGKNKLVSPLLFASLGVLVYFHSYSAVPIALLLFYSLFKEKGYKSLLLCSIVFAIFFIPYFLTAFAGKSAFALELSQLSGIVYQLPLAGLKSISKYFVVIALGLFAMRKNKQALHWTILLSAYSAISIFSFFSEEVLMIGFFRAFRYALYFLFMFSALFVVNVYDRKGIMAKITAVLLAIAIFLPFSSIYYSSAFKGITSPVSNIYLDNISDVISLGSWLEQNTEKGDILLIPPDWNTIRVWSKRAVVITKGDVGMSVWSRSLADVSKKRYDEVAELYASGTAEQFLDAAKKYNASYIITFNKTLDLTMLKQVGKFRVYGVLQN